MTPGSGRSDMINAILIFCVSLCVFVPFLGAIPLFDWDEVNFAEAAREMIVTGDYARVYIDYLPFWEKPPLFFWFQVIAMHVFGIGEFAARLPNAVCGGLTLASIYLIGCRLFDRRFAMLWVLGYAGSILPHLYFRSGIIDPWFNLFIFLSLVFLIRVEVSGSRRVQWLVIAGILGGLAVLTKGPVAYLIISLVVGIFWLLRRFRCKLGPWHYALYSIFCLLTFGVWYGVETIRNGSWFITQFTMYQIRLFTEPGAGHSGFPGYHVIVLLLGCFPASILAINPLFKQKAEKVTTRLFRQWMILLMTVVIIVFSIVESKIVHYSSLCYFPITFLAALYIWALHKRERKVGTWQKAGLILIGLVYVLAGIGLVYCGTHPQVLLNIDGLDHDTRASLGMPVQWNWWLAFPVLFMIPGVGYFVFAQKKMIRKTVVLYVSTGLFIYFGIAFWVAKVQQYSQGPSTEFFASLAGQDVYAVTWGHKSYSRYWDFRKPAPEGFDASHNPDKAPGHARFSDPEFLLTSPEVDKDVYVLTKASKAQRFRDQFPEAQEIGQKGGFAFFVKRVPKN